MSVDFTISPNNGKPKRRKRPRQANSSSTKNGNGLETRAELGAELWKAADILRGAVSPDKYDVYVLPLLFYKRLSDVYVDELNQAMIKYGDEKIAKDEMFHRVVIPKGCLWQDLREISVGVGGSLNRILAEVAKVNQVLDRVVNRSDFNDPTQIPEERLIRLIELFSQHDLSNGNVSPDMLGDAYEYLLKKFNEVAPTRAGEFYTPREVVKVLVGCLRPEEGLTIYDPCVGSAGMLIESATYVEDHDGDPKQVFLFGQEINDDTASMAKMNMFLHDLEAEIVQGDTFVNPKFLETDGNLRQFDLVIANPMWNQKGFKTYQENDKYGRFKYGVTNNSSADWGWIQHMLASLKPEGRMGIVLDQGALFRGGAEGKIRKAALEDDIIEAVVALPEKLFYNTGAPGCLIFLNKSKPEERKNKVLFIYAAEEFEKLSNMNQLQLDHITKIIETYHNYSDSDKFSKVVEIFEIEENDYNLSVTRYVDIFDPPEPIDIQLVWNELKQLEKQRHQTTEKLENYLRELGYE
jgi:type I restriction enzyme M protein